MSDGMVFCQACGKQMHSSARFCPHCGAVPPGANRLMAQGSTVNSMKEAITVCFSKYATFEGRANRAEFWYFQLFIWIVNFAFNFLAGVSQSSTFVALGGLWGLATFIPLLSVAVRRMHDLDKSGWFVLLSVAGAALIWFSLVAWFTAAVVENGAGAGLLGVLTFFAGLGLMIWQIILYCTRGTPGPNRFGPSTIG